MGALTRDLGLDRVLEPAGVLPQAAWRLDPNLPLRPGETLIGVERLNLDAASFRQLRESCGHDGDRVRETVAGIIAERGKMHNPVTGSGGMLIGTVLQAAPDAPHGFAVGDRVATLVSLTLTPLAVTDGLSRWDGASEQIPARGHAVLFASGCAALLPADLPEELALAVFDVCGAPAATERLVAEAVAAGEPPVVAVIGAAGKSGALALAAARRAGARAVVGVVLEAADAEALAAAGLADRVVRSDATDPVGLAAAFEAGVADPGAIDTDEIGRPDHRADLVIVCTDAPGCEHGAILLTRPGGTVLYFSMATSFPAAALGAEGVAADVRMLIGNGFVPGHAALAVELVRDNEAVRDILRRRLGAEAAMVGAASMAGTASVAGAAGMASMAGAVGATTLVGAAGTAGAASTNTTGGTA